MSADDVSHILLDRLDRIRRQQELLAVQESLLIELLGIKPPSPVTRRYWSPRSTVKVAVLDYLTLSAGNARDIVDACKREGIGLDRGTVSSLLSRLVKDGIATYDGRQYRLNSIKEQSRTNEAQTGNE